MTFNRNWFVRHQLTMLVLLNLPIIGQLLRRAMWIPELWLPITHITPDAVHVWIGAGKRRAILYSSSQYAEGLHRSFGWLWALVHAWDMRVANRWLPALNMGLDTYTSQPNSTDGQDVFVRSTNSQARNNLEIGQTAGIIHRTFNKFDLTSIPETATLSAATYSLWKINTTTGAISLYRQKRAWVRDQVLWNTYSTGNSWQTAGGFGVNDCEQSAIASRSIGASGEQQWTNFDLTLLREMCGASPVWANNGWLHKSAAESNDHMTFRSSSYATAGERPKMVIEYALASGWWFFF